MDRLENVSICLPENVKNIIQTLIDHGYEAYAVGGCVRDCLINREPGDWDITTSALPYQVKEIFRRTVDTGIAHGTVTVMIGKDGYEVTTYRLDGDYEDGRHPKNVTFTSSLIEDLKRRDFTINAMAYNDVTGIVDEFDGMGDLKRGVIRCVGKALDRFDEDALRILRAVRFSAQLGYAIDDETQTAIGQLAYNLDKISKERIHTELNKMLLSDNPDYFLLADSLGIMEVIIPEFAAFSDKEKQFCKRMSRLVDKRLSERYAAMLYSCKDGRNVSKILRGLKLDNETINMAEVLIRFSSFEITFDERELRHLIYKIEPKNLERVFSFRKAYELTCNNEEGAQHVEKACKICENIISRGDCLSLKQLAIGGKDLMDIGIKAGRDMGRILEELLTCVLDNPEKNDRDYLLNLAKEVQDKL